MPVGEEKNVQALNDEDLNVSGGGSLMDSAKKKASNAVGWVKDNTGKALGIGAGVAAGLGVAAGAAYGGKKLYDKKKQQRELLEATTGTDDPPEELDYDADLADD